MKKFVFVMLLALIASFALYAGNNEKTIATIKTIDEASGSSITVRAGADMYIDLDMGRNAQIRISEKEANEIIHIIQRYEAVIAEVQSGNDSVVGERFGSSPIIPSRPYETKILFSASCHGSIDKTFLGITVLVNPSNGGGYSRALDTLYLNRAQAQELSNALSDAVAAKRDYQNKVGRLLKLIRSTE